VTPKLPEEPLEPGEPILDDDSWEPPSPALGGLAQLAIALLGAVVAGVLLLAALAAVSWLVQGG
jgi:hypothetical protein